MAHLIAADYFREALLISDYRTIANNAQHCGNAPSSLSELQFSTASARKLPLF
jgi:hypothetical protein